jgi:Cu(I)/Ag(I) efflux system membrane protein CusA/SilA
VAARVGGENVGETVEGLQRFPINVRYPREWRDSLERLRAAHRHADGPADHAGHVAEHRITDGPPMLRSENARLSGWVYVDVRGRDLRSVVQTCSGGGQQVKLPPASGRLVGAVRVPGARHAPS